MIGALRRRPRAAIALTCGCAALSITVLSAGPSGADEPAASAGSTAGSSLAGPAAEFTVGAAAVDGAGDAASAALANAGVIELGRLAAGMWSPEAAGEATLAARTWRWKGWVSGAAGAEAEDGSFAAWRGKPLGIVAVWSDTTADAQTNLEAVDSYANYNGEMDVAVGALVKGDTWQKAAAGAYVQRWTTAMRNLRAKRAGKGTTYVRIAHEMNGNWMPWGVNATNLAAFKAGYRLYASIVRKEFPQARLTFSPNGGNHANVSIDQLWPGNDVVDVIGPDIYDGYPNVTSQAIWNSVSTQWSAPGSPSGLAAWLQYAAGRGKPVALPEWGLPSGDDPAFIQGVHDQLAAAAARPGTSGNAGRVVYDCYFNAEDKFKIYSGPNTSAGATYAKLVWGS